MESAHQNAAVLEIQPKSAKQLPLGAPADGQSDVFISLDNTVNELLSILAISNKGNATFIRAAVATGKSTLARYMVRRFPDRFVMIRVLPSNSDEDIRKKIVKASGSDSSDFTDALESLARQGKTLIVDEAHLVFSFPSLCGDLLKDPDRLSKPDFLFFSTATTGEDDKGNFVVTPAEITKKYMWYPPIPKTAPLVADLKEADVFLSEQSVEFFLKLCCGHWGVFMRAMEWVQHCQEDETEEWDIHKSVSHVKASFTDSMKEELGGWGVGLRSYLVQSRAVRVNGKFSTLLNIPKEFAEVLFGGSKAPFELNRQERNLTIGGFLVPDRSATEGEFVWYDWNNPTKRYGIANSLMAEYYGDVLPSSLGYQSKLNDLDLSEVSGVDFLAQALPFMSFATVVHNPMEVVPGQLQSSLSSNDLLYEDHYNGALASVLQRILKYSVTTPLSPNQGKVDVVVNLGPGKGCCAFELIMAANGQVSTLLAR